jgi:tetratricopeptide (TPR) repeat protein
VIARTPFLAAALAALAVSGAGCGLFGSKEKPKPEPIPPSAAHDMNVEGLERLSRGDFSGAEEMFRRAQNESEKFDDIEGAAETANNQGALAMVRDEPEKALEDHDRAMRLHQERGGDPLALGRTALNRGAALLALKRFDDAEKAFAAARAQFSKGKDQIDIARTHLGLAAVALGRRDAAAAKREAEAAITIARSGGEEGEEILAGGLANVGAAELLAGRLSQAKSAYEAALAIDRRRKSSANLAGDLRALGGIAEKMNQLPEAQRCFSRAGRAERQIGRLERAEQDLLKATELAHRVGQEQVIKEEEEVLADVRTERTRVEARTALNEKVKDTAKQKGVEEAAPLPAGNPTTHRPGEPRRAIEPGKGGTASPEPRGVTGTGAQPVKQGR